MSHDTGPDVRPDGDEGQNRLRVRLLAYGLIAWVGMVVLAIANATFRELFVTPSVGEYLAHVISTATLLMLLAGYILWYFRRSRPHALRERAILGVGWTGLTVAFELIFGHYVAGETWDDLLALYDVTRGNVWILVPLFLLVAPLVVGRRYPR